MKTRKPLPTFENSQTDQKVNEDLGNAVEEIEVTCEMNDLSVTEFAESVAKVLKNSYGSHNTSKFLDTLKKNLK